MANNDQIQVLADQIADYIWERHFSDKLTRMVKFFRAEVTQAASSGKITVKRPFDETELALPYVGSAANLAVGNQCIVLELGNASNAIIIGDGTLSNL